VEFRQQQIKKKRFATANLPCVQGSDSEFCPYSGDVGNQFSANSDSNETGYLLARPFNEQEKRENERRS
jgi:hypothetical protein